MRLQQYIETLAQDFATGDVHLVVDSKPQTPEHLLKALPPAELRAEIQSETRSTGDNGGAVHSIETTGGGFLIFGKTRRTYVVMWRTGREGWAVAQDSDKWHCFRSSDDAMISARCGRARVPIDTRLSRLVRAGARGCKSCARLVD